RPYIGAIVNTVPAMRTSAPRLSKGRRGPSRAAAPESVVVKSRRGDLFIESRPSRLTFFLFFSGAGWRASTGPSPITAPLKNKKNTQSNGLAFYKQAIPTGFERHAHYELRSVQQRAAHATLPSRWAWELWWSLGLL